jgi:hypothetical protein
VPDRDTIILVGMTDKRRNLYIYIIKEKKYNNNKGK